MRTRFYLCANVVLGIACGTAHPEPSTAQVRGSEPVAPAPVRPPASAPTSANPLPSTPTSPAAQSTPTSSAFRAIDDLSPTTLPGSVAFPIADPRDPTLLTYGVAWPIESNHSDALDRLVQSLVETEAARAQTRIAVFGASHVASDAWIQPVRHGLQLRFGNAGHGFILPAPPWASYRHRDVNVDGPYRRWTVRRIRTGSMVPDIYGLMGVALESSDPLAFGNIAFSEPATRLELFYGQREGGGTLSIKIDGAPLTPLVTQGPNEARVHTLFLDDRGHSVEVRPQGDAPVTLYGAVIEREVPGVVVDTLGIPGARAANMLLWDENVFRTYLARRLPNLVVLAYGTNESGDVEQPIATYEANLRAVVARVQSAAPNADCLLIGPSDRPLRQVDRTYGDRPRTHEIIAVQRHVANDMHCAFFDMVAFGGGANHMLAWAALNPPWAQQDLVHYTPRAYQRMGDVLLAELLRLYETRATQLGLRAHTGAEVIP